MSVSTWASTVFGSSPRARSFSVKSATGILVGATLFGMAISDVRADNAPSGTLQFHNLSDETVTFELVKDHLRCMEEITESGGENESWKVGMKVKVYPKSPTGPGLSRTILFHRYHSGDCDGTGGTFCFAKRRLHDNSHAQCFVVDGEGAMNLAGTEEKLCGYGDGSVCGSDDDTPHTPFASSVMQGGWDGANYYRWIWVVDPREVRLNLPKKQ